jgi:signal transduction histidine kinase
MYPDSMKQLRRVTGAGMRAGHRSARLDKYGFSYGRDDGSWSKSRSALRLVASRMLAVRESERKRIATDLHDGVGQSLTMIKLSLAEVLRQLASGAVEEASESLQHLRLSVHGALEEVRHVAMDLRPPMLDDLGLLPTLTWFFREFAAAVPDMSVEKDFGVQEGRIPDELKITIFRLVQEATSNIVKYAHADRLRVQLRLDGDILHFAIEDNGDGFDPAEVCVRSGSDHGLGLSSMRERAMVSGGVYEMNAAPGRGTRMSVSWQLEPGKPESPET